MQPQEREDVMADLINVYSSALARAGDAAQRGQDQRLPLQERLSYRRQASQSQELADQALRMIDELTARTAT